MLLPTFSYKTNSNKRAKFYVVIGSVGLELYLAWIKHPFPVTAASDGRSIVVNSTSGTWNGRK